MSMNNKRVSKENYEYLNNSNKKHSGINTSNSKGENMLVNLCFSKDNPNLKVAPTLIIGDNWYLCSEKLFQFDFEERDQLKEHSLKTFKDLHEQLENYKVKSNLGKTDLLWKPTVVVGLHKNIKKMVYKFPKQLKKIDETIKKYIELRDKATDLENKKKHDRTIKAYANQKRELEETLKNEKNIANMRHKNCLKINWFGDFTNHYVYLSDYCANKDLHNLTRCISTTQRILPVHENLKSLPWLSYMSENLIRFFVIQVLSAIEFFKNVKITHGNLTLDNLLLTGDFQVKITDFACSRFYYGGETFTLVKYDNEIKADFQPPEYFRKDNFVEAKDAHKIDIFSLGCGMFKMATNKSLFDHNVTLLKEKKENEVQTYMTEQLKKLPRLLEENELKRSPDFLKVLQRMLEFFEKGRITLDELLNSDWIKSNQINLKNYESINCCDSAKLITELMKADYISYNNKKLEDEEIDKKTELKIKDYFRFKIDNNFSNLNKTNPLLNINKNRKIRKNVFTPKAEINCLS